MSDYWSEPTVGRLLWTLLVERARERPTPARCARASRSSSSTPSGTAPLVAHGYAAAGLSSEFTRVARPAPASCWPPWRASRRSAHARGARESRPGSWRARGGGPGAAARRGAGGRVRGCSGAPICARYRVPCGACGRGSIGVDALEESAGRDRLTRGVAARPARHRRRGPSRIPSRSASPGRRRLREARLHVGQRLQHDPRHREVAGTHL
jgi:hypothetical protein